MTGSLRKMIVFVRMTSSKIESGSREVCQRAGTKIGWAKFMSAVTC